MVVVLPPTQFKMEQAMGFLDKGHRVKLLIAFAGPWARDAAFGTARRLADLVRSR